MLRLSSSWRSVSDAPLVWPSACWISCHLNSIATAQTCPTCQNGGTCVQGACQCVPGSNGTSCQNMYNCALYKYTIYSQTTQVVNPCGNGACPDNGASILCACNTGYTGSTCNTIVDNCASSPCQNGASCLNMIGSYQCLCATGYTGAQCQTIIDNCASLPCANGGTCANKVGAFTCTCATGYTGAQCQSVVNYCTGNLCQSGTCINGTGSYTCSCNPGSTGTYCNISSFQELIASLRCDVN